MQLIITFLGIRFILNRELFAATVAEALVKDIKTFEQSLWSDYFCAYRPWYVTKMFWEQPLHQ
jgi:hypothetical protein